MHKCTGQRVASVESQRASAFAAAYVTESRLQKGIEHLQRRGLLITMRNLPRFIQWVMDDIQQGATEYTPHTDSMW